MQWHIEHSLSIHSKADGRHVVFFFLAFSFQSDSDFQIPAEIYFFQFPALSRITAVINKGEEDFDKQGQHTG